MASKTYSIFGCGAAGLYTAWRLLNGQARAGGDPNRQLQQGDVLELFDWGKYDFSKEFQGTRAPGARVCTWHYQNNPDHSYLELGGMRYSQWNGQNDGKAQGHRLVTTVIAKLGLDRYAVPFNESSDPLYYLRARNLYQSDISSRNPAPYAANNFGAATTPDQGFAVVEAVSVTSTSGPGTRKQWDAFYQQGRITAELPSSSIFQKGDLLKDIGYWNLMYDQLGSEGYQYAADGNGYSSNVINWNSAVAFEANNEFTPGNQYMTLTTGYSGMFHALFAAIEQLATQRGVTLQYYPDQRLRSIHVENGVVHYTIATREDPYREAARRTTAAAWLAMPRAALEQVAQGSRYDDRGGLDVLNDRKVKLYLESAIMQPSYKVGMFFEKEWWLDPATPYPPKINGYEVTDAVIASLKEQDFPPVFVQAMSASDTILNVQFASADALVKAVEEAAGERMTVKQETLLLFVAKRNTMGPSVTDTPIRMVVYFGNNAADRNAKPVYGLLASYDDETFTTFWRELELGPNEERHVPIADDIQPLIGPRKVPDRMVKMLRKQLAELHFGPNSDFADVPEPIEAAYVDWSLPPFRAGYHAWAAHYDVADVQQKIRKPSQLIDGKDAPIFIVGECYSNDQAWVEGAYCTAESVLNDFFDIEPLIDDSEYPFICQPT
ncbi:hypothetical protein BLA6860_07045 [Burkholderia lata]|uniref:hypothetical protein n=1 Tax=Burkholderia lata (strain ATCC 17760 / DSM 23089 / LMG 22485 / NCIMB 9086 / R18194 / 383) TaxID=482957 RepID=UPI001452CA59|nr:hypothetical protein [Burkholderia lata]VWC41790.1 hypothetical protein BLA6860_07045 [Burkholderia lata]